MGRRVDVKADHIADLAGELRVAAELEGSQPMRRQAVGAPDLLHRADGQAATLAMARQVQCVISPGGAPSVRSISRAATGPGTGALPGFRVLSRSRRSTPASRKRRCQRQTQGLDTPARRMISIVPQPSAVARMIVPARHASGHCSDRPERLPAAPDHPAQAGPRTSLRMPLVIQQPEPRESSVSFREQRCA
jgi:hypothetical protein